MSYTKDYIDYIIKKNETLRTISPNNVYINRINNRLVFKIKDRYKLELQMRETVGLFGSTKELIDKIKNEEKVQSLEVVFVQCNLVDNQYQQKFEVLYTFSPYKSYAYLLNVVASNLVFLKTYNTESDEIIITFTNQNGKPLEIEDKVDLTIFYSINVTIFYRTKNKEIC